MPVTSEAKTLSTFLKTKKSVALLLSYTCEIDSAAKLQSSARSIGIHIEAQELEGPKNIMSCLSNNRAGNSHLRKLLRVVKHVPAVATTETRETVPSNPNQPKAGQIGRKVFFLEVLSSFKAEEVLEGVAWFDRTVRKKWSTSLPLLVIFSRAFVEPSYFWRLKSSSSVRMEFFKARESSAQKRFRFRTSVNAWTKIEEDVPEPESNQVFKKIKFDGTDCRKDTGSSLNRAETEIWSHYQDDRAKDMMSVFIFKSFPPPKSTQIPSGAAVSGPREWGFRGQDALPFLGNCYPELPKYSCSANLAFESFLQFKCSDLPSVDLFVKNLTSPGGTISNDDVDALVFGSFQHLKSSWQKTMGKNVSFDFQAFLQGRDQEKLMIAEKNRNKKDVLTFRNFYPTLRSCLDTVEDIRTMAMEGELQEGPLCDLFPGQTRAYFETICENVGVFNFSGFPEADVHPGQLKQRLKNRLQNASPAQLEKARLSQDTMVRETCSELGLFTNEEMR
jgi:hypothetical protein